MDISKPIACSRMYNLSPRIRSLWDALFALVSLHSGVELEIIAHAAPAPLSELWTRPDMGAVFMCGYPFSRTPEGLRPAALAAPVSSEEWSLDQPLYASHILVASTGPVNAVADLAAARWGWTVRDSQSGYHAARSYLAGRFAGTMKQSTTVGPLLNPSGIVAALKDGRIDAGAIDAYAFQLLSMHERDAIDGLRILATTDSLPAPLLVAAQTLPADIATALQRSLVTLHETPEGAAALERLGLRRFSAVAPSAYDVLPQRADDADRRLGISW
ncbi:MULTISPECIES: phosphate/phosphite/phosphonate ABC transporter substrate-binding protein [Rhizobium]|uniref:phosphate/phosphite/phosphonate ABC transporter substrate-binding protein n=1 Tax=Rhizobium TaxID=379 RepID=UPI0014415F34|nr:MULTISPECIES: PhnD/SsuA/transferrin family substrate-binding protein [Rhizobium]MBY3156251.1 phosphate/phosphite/phosphonate ABC transporter substrate-binding protein [Rhizobium laguerreae]MBY3444783.1 phosphate/phosphite/phosphonate ABC transporter substrate-binding protein [Rhizobium laguerreae]MBY5744519.1 phosphate/phosphite/phosphonate ABC transporter substrate-binding protein [Rhizobium leguminosarum]NKN10135.1 PhnD/SsuA/transferrin family substrate-binding protein [Rhizobium laguerrea